MSFRRRCPVSPDEEDALQSDAIRRRGCSCLLPPQIESGDLDKPDENIQSSDPDEDIQFSDPDENIQFSDPDSDEDIQSSVMKTLTFWTTALGPYPS